uniref:Retrotransposon protein, putative, unclassified n=1 Tax=Tanacetum cinerariifolium TaxID=118510 RepID=A0A699HQY9_TANCI|nr:retrotransposon protein, putative, unclassified [Tanacetum cinerariifolium]
MHAELKYVESLENEIYELESDKAEFSNMYDMILDGENLDKMKEKGDPCIMVGYSTQSKGYRVYNKRTRLVVESIHIRFDEIKEMSKTSVANDTLGLVPQRQKASNYDNSDPVYVAQPDGFVDPDHPEKVYRLRKALYGLKQALKAWYDELLKFLTSNFFTKGLPIHQSPRGIFINQAKYALEILHKHGMKKGQSIGTPMAMKPKLDEDLSGNPVDQTNYHSKIGSLMYLTSSRPDIVQADCTAMSSADAEYVALSASCAQVMWMMTQLQDYGLNYNNIPLYCDSQSAIAISCNPVQHSRTKHIHTRYYFIKEHVTNSIIELYFVRTEYQLADMFTKALPEDRFKYLVRRIGMRCLTPVELEVLGKESA